jgi:beta-glucosidase
MTGGLARASTEDLGAGRTGLRFPKGFTWGAGLSAHQVEGGNTNSDWWEFEQAGGIARNEVSGRATDHYHRFPEDFSLARSLNLCAIKLSVEWARIEPEPGRIDEGALRHYEEVVETLTSVGLEPYVVLHHFTSPLWLGQFGWWEGKDTPKRFAEYAGTVAEKLGRWVRYWMPINEPVLLAVQGYGSGLWPPLVKGGIPKAKKVGDRLIDAHHAAREAVRSARPDAQVGVAVNTVAVIADEDSRRERALHAFVDYMTNWWYLEKTEGNADFIGLQYYSRVLPQLLLKGAGLVAPPGPEGASDLGWPVFSEGLYRMVRETAKRFDVPIHITENGIADAEDSRRAAFITNHLAWLHRAMREGADVQGYFHWALTDNFEWLEGFEPRFGLVGIDYDTLARAVRPSAGVYAETCRSGLVEVAAGHPSLAAEL